MNPIDGSNITRISPLNGRTTCSFVLNDGNILYSSTMGGNWCPPEPDATAGYLWPIYSDMQIYIGQAGGRILGHVAPSDAYDAESTLSPDGKTIVFTSARSGDLELYLYDLETSSVRRMTYAPGYDGGAYFSHNGKMLVWRANRPQVSQDGKRVIHVVFFFLFLLFLSVLRSNTCSFLSVLSLSLFFSLGL